MSKNEKFCVYLYFKVPLIDFDLLALFCLIGSKIVNKMKSSIYNGSTTFLDYKSQAIDLLRAT